MGMKIEPIENKSFGAVVRHVDLRTISDDDFATLRSAFLEYGFLLVPDQSLSDADNIAFGQRFGELEFGGTPMANQEKQADGSFGRVYDLDTQVMRTNVGNEAWHTDSTYKPISSKCAMLYGVTVPDQGGETELADMRAGYDTLDQATKDRIEDLAAYHSTQFSQANDVGDFPPVNPQSIYHGEAYLRRLVKVHPETGKKNLFLGRHAFGIPGLSREESRRLLMSLLEHVISDPARVYTHAWRPGDLLFWDNRALLHRARPYDYSKPRVLTATRVAGDQTELSYYPDDPAAAGGRSALAEELAILRTEKVGLRFPEATATRAN